MAAASSPFGVSNTRSDENAPLEDRRDVANTELVGVADANPKGREAKSKSLGVPGFAEYQTMLERVRPELVAVGPRWLDQHRDMVVACAEHGVKGIYLEKPMCRDLQEADDMVAACESRT